MQFEPLNLKTELHSKSLAQRVEVLDRLLKELDKMTLTPSIIGMINEEVKSLNEFKWTERDLSKQILKTQNKIVKVILKEQKLVPKNYYRNLWMVLGMSAFGLPLGVAFGISIGQIGLMAIGLPIGMGIGLALGSYMDKKAKEEGRQLDVELR